jgi:hypothetical protein
MTPRHPFAVAVVELVARAYGIDPELIWQGDRLSATITEARWLSWAHTKDKCGWSNVETGRAFGTDASSVRHSLGRLEGRPKGPWYTSAAQALDRLSLGEWQAGNCGVSGTVASAVTPRAPSLDQDLNSSLSESSSILSSLPKGPVSKPARVRGPKPRLRQVPAAWEPNDGHRALARELGISIESQVVLFRDHEFKDPKSNFDAAFRTWMRRSAQYSKPPGLQQHMQTMDDSRRRPESRILRPVQPVGETVSAAELAAMARGRT